MKDRALAEPTTELTIQQVSRLTGLSEPTLRYYEKVGLIEPVSRDSSSRHRKYDPETISHIASLASLRAVGMSIEAMRTLMHSRGHASETIDTKIALLSEHRDEIARETKRLAARQRFLSNRIAYWQAVQRDDATEVARLSDEGNALAKKLI
jgi:DNA-binding transcriptional MerR regulator